MFKRLLSLCLAMSLAVPMPVSANNTTSLLNTSDVKQEQAIETPVVGDTVGEKTKSLDLSLGNRAQTEINLLTTSEMQTTSGYYADMIIKKVTILEGSIPVGLHLQSKYYALHPPASMQNFRSSA